MTYIDKPFIVLGYHRSGTSLLAGLMKRCGIHMGDTLFPALPSNPRGHYEERSVLDFHRIMLKRMANTDGGIETVPIPEVVKKHWDYREALKAIEGGFSHLKKHEDKPWGWKDPRTMVFCNQWRSVFPEARWLVSIRHPDKVAESLKRRDGWDKSVVFKSWLEFHRRLTPLVTLSRCAVFDYDRLVEDPVLLYNFFLSRAEGNDMCGFVPSPDCVPQLRNFGTVTLRHVTNAYRVPGPFETMWRALYARTIK